jgi:asparagine N-glycosylation enzyme membrane subunit Stt3
MTNSPTQTSRDWLGSVHTSLLAWWMPKAVILAGLFVPVSFRAVIWIIALIWMGTACILNARRCNRTHCRYTGPYYLAMIVPVFVLGMGVVSAGIYGWISLGLFIVGGSGLIWWATERTWGKFS